MINRDKPPPNPPPTAGQSTASSRPNDQNLSVETVLWDMAAAAEGKPSAWRRYGPWVSGALSLLALIVAIFHLSEIEQFLVLLGNSRPEWLLWLLLAQTATYICAAGVWQRTLRHVGYARSLLSLVPLGLAKLFTDQVVPSGGISGSMLVMRGLVRRHIPTEKVASVFLVGFFSFYIAYLLVDLSDVALLWLHHHLSSVVLAVAGSFTVFIVIIVWTVFWLKRRGIKRLPDWLKRFSGVTAFLRIFTDAPAKLLYDVWLMVQTVGLQIGVFLLDAITLWMSFYVLGHPVPFWIVYVSFIMASVVATLGPIPLGLGTFEAGSVGMLSLLGVPVEAALAATLLLRGFTFWLPMAPGLWLARRELRRTL